MTTSPRLTRKEVWIREICVNRVGCSMKKEVNFIMSHKLSLLRIWQTMSISIFMKTDASHYWLTTWGFPSKFHDQDIVFIKIQYTKICVRWFPRMLQRNTSKIVSVVDCLNEATNFGNKGIRNFCHASQVLRLLYILHRKINKCPILYYQLEFCLLI